MFNTTFSLLKSLVVKQNIAQAREFAAKASCKPSLESKASMLAYRDAMGKSGKASFGCSDMIEFV